MGPVPTAPGSRDVAQAPGLGPTGFDCSGEFQPLRSKDRSTMPAAISNFVPAYCPRSRM